VFETSSGLRNWLHAFYLTKLDPDVYDRKIIVAGWSFVGHYRHPTGPAGVGLIMPLSENIVEPSLATPLSGGHLFIKDTDSIFN
jgi:hypothetical protein